MRSGASTLARCEHRRLAGLQTSLNARPELAGASIEASVAGGEGSEGQDGEQAGIGTLDNQLEVTGDVWTEARSVAGLSDR